MVKVCKFERAKLHKRSKKWHNRGVSETVTPRTQSGNNPWDRQPGEGLASWESFRIYLHLEDRDLQGVADKTGRVLGTVKNLSAKNNWAERAEAWDAHLAAAEDRTILATREQMAAEHLRQWGKVRKIAEAHLGLLVDDGLAVGSMTAQSALALLDRATHYERLILGEATERQEVRADLDLSRLSPEELLTLKALRRKASGSGSSS